MRKKISYVLSLLALLFVLPACQQQSDVEEATLDLSTQTLTFAKEASEQSLTVQTNKDSWSAISPQEATWLTLTLEGNTLKVRAEANDQGRDRLGAIVVNAGGLQKRVTVRQSAADVVHALYGKFFVGEDQFLEHESPINQAFFQLADEDSL